MIFGDFDVRIKYSSITDLLLFLTNNKNGAFSAPFSNPFYYGQFIVADV